MLLPALVAFFRYRVVRSLLILACWTPAEQVKLVREISKQGFAATFACEAPASALDDSPRHGLQGVVYFNQPDDPILQKIKSDQFSGRFVWLVVGAELPPALHRVRYDADLVLLRTDDVRVESTALIAPNEVVHFEDIYVHPRSGAAAHPWVFWSTAGGLYVPVENERARIQRRFNFNRYPLRIVAPVGHYSEEWYNGSYAQYVVDETLTELDAGIRCGYTASQLIIQLINATEVLITTELWGTTNHNSSMLLMLLYEKSELGGGILRMLLNRIEMLDYVMPIWPFNVGFTYLAERESSSNMFVSPFSAGVWCACAAIGAVLCGALRLTARSNEEKDDAYCAVLATWLQQDASAVPKGISGRWTFTVLSVCAMLVHAYYTSAIVSALMSAGSGGPRSLRALADSQYAIASEDYDYMRYLFFDVETNWEDLEYLKRRKKTAKFYQELERGVQLIQEGSTAFHSEYNQIYPHFKRFTDDQICKLQHVDTIPEAMTWVTTTRRGQYTSTFRAAGARLHEAGLGKRLVSRLRARRPPCRAQLLAERVRFGDVASLLAFTLAGALLSLAVLGLEILLARNAEWRRGTRPLSASITEYTDTIEDGISGEDDD